MTDHLPANLIFELPKLVVFAEVARRDSFAGAAKALGLSRSTVSQNVAALEEALAVRLIERTTRSVRATDAGRGLLSTAQSILETWSKARVEATMGQHEPRGTLVVTAPDTIAHRFVIPAISEFLHRFPACRADLRVTPQTLDLIDDGIDVAVRGGPLADSTQGATLLTTTKHVIVGTPALMQAWPATDPEDLADAPWVDHRLRRRRSSIQRKGISARLPQHCKTVVDSASTLIDVTRRGIGFALLPELLIQDELARGELQIACEGWQGEPRLSFHAVTASPRARLSRVTEFVTLLATQFQ